jgi:hypothetical protein
MYGFSGEHERQPPPIIAYQAAQFAALTQKKGG